MASAYLRNVWYQAAFSDEIGSKPLARTLLDTPVVFFRTEGGLHALHDRCPHRFAPLSMGEVRDEALVCGYHGVAFDGAGNCVRNPHGRIPTSMKVETYPVAERHSAVWIWMGDPERADPDLIPDLSFIDETPETARITFYIPTAANYRLVNDNLMDLSHADFLHPASLGGIMTGANTSTDLVDGKVVVEWTNDDCTAPARFQMKVPSPAKADIWTQATWRAPAVMVIAVAVTPPGAERRREDEVWALHSMTPETATSTHYFVCGTRSDRVDDLKYSEQLRTMLRQAFWEEDKPMLEAQQARLGAEDFEALRPIMLKVDAGAALVRAELNRRIAAEQTAAAPTELYLELSA